MEGVLGSSWVGLLLVELFGLAVEHIMDWRECAGAGVSVPVDAGLCLQSWESVAGIKGSCLLGPLFLPSLRLFSTVLCVPESPSSEIVSLVVLSGNMGPPDTQPLCTVPQSTHTPPLDLHSKNPSPIDK